MIYLAIYLVVFLETRIKEFAMRAMLVLSLLVGFACSELMAIDPVPPNCDQTRPVISRCPEDVPVLSQVGRYQIHGEYRLDTVTGEVVRVADIITEVAVAAPSSDTFTLRVTSGVDTIHEAVVPVFAVDGDSILTVDIQEALGIWLRSFFERMFAQPVAV